MSYLLTEVCQTTDLIYYHGGKVSVHFIDLRDGLDDGRDLPLSLLYHHSAVFHHRHLVTREPLVCVCVCACVCECVCV